MRNDKTIECTQHANDKPQSIFATWNVHCAAPECHCSSHSLNPRSSYDDIVAEVQALRGAWYGDGLLICVCCAHLTKPQNVLENTRRHAGFYILYSTLYIYMSTQQQQNRR